MGIIGYWIWYWVLDLDLDLVFGNWVCRTGFDNGYYWLLDLVLGSPVLDLDWYWVLDLGIG